MLETLKNNLKHKTTFLQTAAVVLLSFSLVACNNQNAAEFHQEGLKLMEEGNPNGAIVFFKNALEEDSNNFKLRLDLAKAYIQAGKRTQAEAELNKSLIQQPTNIEALLTFANFYSNTTDAEKALNYLKQIEDLQGPTAETRELFANNYRFLGRNIEAEKAYQDTLKLEPNRASAKINLASMYLAQGRVPDGVTLLDEVLSATPNHINALQLYALISEDKGDLAAAEGYYKKIVELVPTDPAPLFTLGELYIKQSKIQEAEEVHATLLKNFKSSMLEYLLGGMLAFQKGDFDSASKLFQQSIQLSPSVNGLYYLASSLHKIGNSESALSNLRRILDVQPTNSSALLLTAQILTEQGRNNEAEYEINRLIKAYPQNASAYNLLGVVQRNLGEYDKALASFEQALKLDSTIVQATMSRSDILIQQNKENQAIAELEKSIEENNESIAVRTALYNHYMNKKNYDKAFEIVEEGLKDQPNNSLLLTMKAGVYMAQQENEKAVSSLKAATSLNPTFLPATQLLLNIYITQGDNQAALELCDAYLAEVPESESFLVTSANLLDNLGRADEATQRLEKANALNSERALVSLVRRALNNNDKALAEKYLTDKLAAFPTPQMRYMLATYYVEQNDLQKALGVYNTEELKSTTEGLVSKFRLNMAAKQYKAALAEAEAIIAAAPTSNDGYVLKAFALEQDDNFEEAFNTLENAYKTTESPELLVQLANLCLRDKRYDKALSFYRTALLKDPNSKDALTGQAYALLQQKKFDDAIASYEKILALYPNDLANINNLAMALAEEGTNSSRAVELATQVFVQSPENAGVIDTYAFTLIKNKQIKEAINVLENGLQANPNSAILNYRYGIALLANNKRSEAVEALQTAVEIGGFAEIENAKELINDNK